MQINSISSPAIGLGQSRAPEPGACAEATASSPLSHNAMPALAVSEVRYSRIDQIVVPNVLAQGDAELGIKSKLSQDRRRAAGVLGGDSREIFATLNLDIPVGDDNKVRSHDLIAAMEKLDVRDLRAAGIAPVAVFDFDKTLMADDVFVEFTELAAAQAAFSEEGNPGVVDLLVDLGIGGMTREQLAARSVNDNVTFAIELAAARHNGAPADQSISNSELFFIVAAAMKGMLKSRAVELARELYEVGAPGRAPYKTHVFDPSSGPDDSAADLVDILQLRGVECYIVTAGMTFLAREGARYLGIPASNVCGGDVETKDGRFTGRIVDVHQIGKQVLVRKNIGTPPLFAFGDTASTDGPMLEMALAPGFMVDPRQKFLDMVRREGLDFITLTYRS